jgi:hypothetical protein
MRFYTTPHQLDCGIDLQARTMDLCVVNQEGEMLVHRNRPAGAEPFPKPWRPTGPLSWSASHASAPGSGWPTSVRTQGSLLASGPRSL